MVLFFENLLDGMCNRAFHEGGMAKHKGEPRQKRARVLPTLYVVYAQTEWAPASDAG